MTRIEVFYPALCCSSGVCGVDVDQKLVDFAADVDWARTSGAQIARFNLSQQPMAFAERAVVKGMLERTGEDALPLTLVDGEIALAGRYPTRADLARWAGIAQTLEPVSAASAASATSATSNCCSGGKCC
ncbi:MAG: arsenite efflux transporter metallochaperone ArsD [Burkholderiales bacterium]|nr:arsenite efflux transporter metallochaperone ArsD [Burkholderiales bacterium]